jgi:hypothetical protein
MASISKANKTNKEAEAPTYLPEGWKPTIDEVVIGRGMKIANLPGNRRFQAHIEGTEAKKVLVFSLGCLAHHPLTKLNSSFYTLFLLAELVEYEQSDDKTHKSYIINRVLDKIRKGSKVGGFVKKDPKTKRWIAIVRDATARVSVAQAFRDRLHENYSSSKYSKQKKRWGFVVEGPQQQTQQQTQQQQTVQSSCAASAASTPMSVTSLQRSALMIQQQRFRQHPQHQQQLDAHMMLALARPATTTADIRPLKVTSGTSSCSYLMEHAPKMSSNNPAPCTEQGFTDILSCVMDVLGRPAATEEATPSFSMDRQQHQQDPFEPIPLRETTTSSGAAVEQSSLALL